MKPRIMTGALWASLLAGILWGVSCSDRADHAAGNSNIPLSIEPNVAVGPVRAGMRVQELVAKLGEPDRRTANALEYTRLGFAVMPGPEGSVHVVMCGDVTGINGPLVKAFTGRTRDGIGLGSTREDLVKAYGEPTASEKLRGGTESIRYDPLGITFTLEAGKVYHMIVRLQGAQDPDRTVSLEPFSNTNQR
jgi:hypothetical protein